MDTGTTLWHIPEDKKYPKGPLEYEVGYLFHLRAYATNLISNICAFFVKRDARMETDMKVQTDQCEDEIVISIIKSILLILQKV